MLLFPQPLGPEQKGAAVLFQLQAGVLQQRFFRPEKARRPLPEAPPCFQADLSGRSQSGRPPAPGEPPSFPAVPAWFPGSFFPGKFSPGRWSSSACEAAPQNSPCGRGPSAQRKPSPAGPAPNAPAAFSPSGTAGIQTPGSPVPVPFGRPSRSNFRQKRGCFPCPVPISDCRPGLKGSCHGISSGWRPCIPSSFSLKAPRLPYPDWWWAHRQREGAPGWKNAAPMARLVFSPPLFTALSRSFNWLKSLASGSSSVSPVWRISAMGQYRFTTPSSQAILPDRTPKRVDFPAPLRPMSPILSPSGFPVFQYPARSGFHILFNIQCI